MEQAPFTDIFATDACWLEERYRFDVQARSRAIESLMLDGLPPAGELRLLDVGSGLGANTRYFGERLGRDQFWTLVEEAPALAEGCRRELCRWAESRAWPWGLTGEVLVIRAPGTRLSIRIVQDSMFELDGRIDLSRVDLLTANGVLDLVSREAFTALAGALADFRIPVLATLNYGSMRFEPDEAGDEEIIRLYERHMRKPRSFGRPMGPESGPAVAGCLRRAGYDVFSEESVWSIENRDRFMLGCLLGFIGRALSEPWAHRPDPARLSLWLDRKRAQVEDRGARLLVTHSDIFAALPKR